MTPSLPDLVRVFLAEYVPEPDRIGAEKSLRHLLAASSDADIRAFAPGEDFDSLPF